MDVVRKCASVTAGRYTSTSVIVSRLLPLLSFSLSLSLRFISLYSLETPPLNCIYIRRDLYIAPRTLSSRGRHSVSLYNPIIRAIYSVCVYVRKTDQRQKAKWRSDAHQKARTPIYRVARAPDKFPRICTVSRKSPQILFTAHAVVVFARVYRVCGLVAPRHTRQFRNNRESRHEEREPSSIARRPM